ncbi:MAG: hydantoinase/oxoprolinase family protein, partial [Rhizobiales bacterium]|nr:hydantoinase/oxoprolinase family protein [Hyphomicrobiales bacterium]
DGLLTVGPDSAGAVPGPACYGRGGVQPTLSDANLVLGRLPDELVGGGMALDEGAARASIEPVARTLGVSIEQAAMSIARIVTSNMVRAIRLVSIERGHDPREFALMPFGGAGGLHAFEVAREMGIGQMLVPLAPGILCAEGLVVSDLKEDFVATCRTPVSGDLSVVRRGLEHLATEADAWFEREGILKDSRHISLVADMRYIGQNYELGVAVPGDGLPELPAQDKLHQMFFEEHRRAYGHFDPDAPVEVINLRLGAVGRLQRFEVAVQKGKTAGTQMGSRTIWFDEAGGVESLVWHRDALAPGTVVPGPAVIEQFDATTLVPPGATATIDVTGNMLIGLS